MVISVRCGDLETASVEILKSFVVRLKVSPYVPRGWARSAILGSVSVIQGSRLKAWGIAKY